MIYWNIHSHIYLLILKHRCRKIYVCHYAQYIEDDNSRYSHSSALLDWSCQIKITGLCWSFDNDVEIFIIDVSTYIVFLKVIACINDVNYQGTLLKRWNRNILYTVFIWKRFPIIISLKMTLPRKSMSDKC